MGQLEDLESRISYLEELVLNLGKLANLNETFIGPLVQRCQKRKRRFTPYSMGTPSFSSSSPSTSQEVSNNRQLHFDDGDKDAEEEIVESPLVVKSEALDEEELGIFGGSCSDEFGPGDNDYEESEEMTETQREMTEVENDKTEGTSVSSQMTGKVSELKFIKSTRLKSLISYEGYLYEKNTTRGSTDYYICNQRYRGCKARMTIYNVTGDFKSTGSHPGHLPNPDKIRNREIIGIAKEIAMDQPTLPLNEVASLMEVSIDNTNGSIAESIAKSSGIQRIIRRARRVARGEHSLGTCREDFTLPENLKMTKDDKRFLLHDYPGADRLLIFASDEMLQILSSSDKWIVGGSFKAAPAYFNQVFVIYANCMDAVIPCVYAYLPEKKIDFYKIVLERICTIPGHAMYPKVVISDFDLGIIQACRIVLPTTELKGCYFQLGQDIFKQVVQEGLNTNYVSDINFRCAIQGISSLAFVPERDVFSKFMELRSQFDTEHPIRNIFLYFQNNYLGHDYNDVNYPIKFWNSYERFLQTVPRTTYSVEGWDRLDTVCNGSNPITIWKSIQVIINENQHWNLEVQKFRSGIKESGRSKYRELDSRLKKIIDSYLSTIDTLQYLRGISICLHD